MKSEHILAEIDKIIAAQGDIKRAEKTEVNAAKSTSVKKEGMLQSDSHSDSQIRGSQTNDSETDDSETSGSPLPLSDAQAGILQGICELLDREVEVFNWTGFYLASATEERMLELGPFTGEPTDHTQIPYGTGICGQAAETLDTFVVQDVSKAENYLACSVTVKSEIVVPIMKNGTFLGELDIDSHTKDAITPELQELCEEICRRLAAEVF